MKETNKNVTHTTSVCGLHLSLQFKSQFSFCVSVSLSQCFPSLKKLQLPSLSKLPFKSIDQKFLDKSKTQLNAFLQVSMQTVPTVEVGYTLI